MGQLINCFLKTSWLGKKQACLYFKGNFKSFSVFPGGNRGIFREGIKVFIKKKPKKLPLPKGGAPKLGRGGAQGEKGKGAYSSWGRGFFEKSKKKKSTSLKKF